MLTDNRDEVTENNIKPVREKVAEIQMSEWIAFAVVASLLFARPELQAFGSRSGVSSLVRRHRRRRRGRSNGKTAEGIRRINGGLRK